jgi:hypothetical protein
VDSTVSKVLRQKEKYLNPDDRSSSPIRKNKVKSPDVEKTLSAWFRRENAKRAVMDDEIQEQYRHFSLGTAGSADPVNTALSSTWLAKFKQKNGMEGGKLVRRQSETSIPDSARMSPAPTPSQPSSALSPASPQGRISPAAGEDDRDTAAGSYMDFQLDAHGLGPRQSNASLSSNFTDNATSSFSGSALSPTAPFNFSSPDPGSGRFLPHDQARGIPPSASNFHRPRSQTFPTLDLEYINQPQQAEALTPKFQPSATAPSSALDSPMNDPSSAVFEDTIALSQLRRSSSNSSFGPRSAGPNGPLSATSVGSSPTSPTHEDARRAADTLLQFIKNASAQFADAAEYDAVARLVEKLRIRPGFGMTAMGGLSRIPEGEVEMANAPAALKVETTMGA